MTERLEFFGMPKMENAFSARLILFVTRLWLTFVADGGCGAHFSNNGGTTRPLFL